MKNFLQKSCLTAIMLCFSVVGFAHDFEVDGIYCRYNDDGVSVSVTYRGSSYDDYYNEYSGDLVIPSDVTYNGTTYRVASIGYSAFSGCSGLTSVTIPNSVTSIDYSAFENCSGLTTVTIPNSVTSIGIYAFRGCSGLSTVTIPNSVTSIGDYAFRFCSGLTSVQFNAKNCKSVSSTWLLHCDNIISFTIGENVKTIPEYLCYSLSKLTSITIPNSVTSIGNSAFEDCSGLTTVTIPNSVTSIGYSAFENCSGLTTVQFNAENCSLSGANWLSDCKNITSFTFGENVKTIPAYLCYGLSKLNHVTIPNSVTSIGGSAFRGCSGLTSVTIPNSVTSIGSWAFWGCYGLTSIQCDALTPPSLGKYVFYNVDTMACTLIVPEESVEAYKAADQWRDFLNVSGLKEIAIEDSNISVESGMIINRNNEIIEVYNLSGAKVYTGSDAEVSLNGGMYIVKVGDKVVKIAI